MLVVFFFPQKSQATPYKTAHTHRQPHVWDYVRTLGFLIEGCGGEVGPPTIFVAFFWGRFFVAIINSRLTIYRFCAPLTLDSILNGDSKTPHMHIPWTWSVKEELRWW